MPPSRRSEEFAALLAPGDTIVDGGNSNFQDSKRRHALLAARGIHFVDAGISGGVWGLKNGYGTMVGGDVEAVTAAGAHLPVAGARGRLHPLRTVGRRPLHQDGPQRHRVRPDAGVRGGLRDPPRVGVPARPGGGGERLAVRHGHPLVAAGAGRHWPSSSTARTCRTSAAGSPTRARAAGRCRRRWISTCRRRSSRCRC